MHPIYRLIFQPLSSNRVIRIFFSCTPSQVINFVVCPISVNMVNKSFVFRIWYKCESYKPMNRFFVCFVFFIKIHIQIPCFKSTNRFLFTFCCIAFTPRTVYYPINTPYVPFCTYFVITFESGYFLPSFFHIILLVNQNRILPALSVVRLSKVYSNYSQNYPPQSEQIRCSACREC